MDTYGQKHKRTLYGVVVAILLALFGLVLMLTSGGCIPTEQQIYDLSNDVATLNASIDEQQSKLVTQIDKVQGHVALVNEAVKAAKTLPEKAAAGIEASRPFNPYADEMAAGLGLLTLVGGLFAKKKIGTLSAKYMAHKQGVERVVLDGTPEFKAEMYDAIGKARAANGV